MASLKDELNPEESNISLLLGSPSFVIGVISAYLLFIYQIGPSIMKNRPPFKLKGLIFAYNIVQVVSCLYLINLIWNLTSWSLFVFRDCKYYGLNSPGRKEFDDISKFIYWLKIVELIDTIIFVLRKKTNQITYLHVFHHSSTVSFGYILLKYYRGKSVLYPMFLNSWVHVIMYTYYFFSNICSAEVMKKFILIKKSITIIQMIQFCMILTQAVIVWINCDIPLILVSYYCIVVAVIFYGFYDFYKKSYKSANEKELSKREN